MIAAFFFFSNLNSLSCCVLYTAVFSHRIKCVNESSFVENLDLLVHSCFVFYKKDSTLEHVQSSLTQLFQGEHIHAGVIRTPSTLSQCVGLASRSSILWRFSVRLTCFHASSFGQTNTIVFLFLVFTTA